VFVLLNLFHSFHLDRLLYSGQLLDVYPLHSLMLTGLLLLFYLLFYLVARELDINTRLKQENQFLHMQTAQYKALRSAIDETRRARHDLRHHCPVRPGGAGGLGGAVPLPGPGRRQRPRRRAEPV
jgi:hypothetical protein